MVNHTERSIMFDDDAVVRLFNALYLQAIDDYIYSEDKLNDKETKDDIRLFYQRELEDSRAFLFIDNPMEYSKSFLEKAIMERRRILHEKKIS